MRSSFEKYINISLSTEEVFLSTNFNYAQQNALIDLSGREIIQRRKEVADRDRM